MDKLITLAGAVAVLLLALSMSRFYLKSNQKRFQQSVDNEVLLRVIRRLNTVIPKPLPYYLLPSELEARMKQNLYDKCTLEQVVYDMGHHCGVDTSTIEVQLRRDDRAGYAGQIKIAYDHTVILIQKDACTTVDTMTAVLAHELMHFFLNQYDIHMENMYENEILTDTATIYFGFSEYMYRGYRFNQDFRNPGTMHKAGYLSQADIAYITRQIYE